MIWVYPELHGPQWTVLDGRIQNDSLCARSEERGAKPGAKRPDTGCTSMNGNCVWCYQIPKIEGQPRNELQVET